MTHARQRRTAAPPPTTDIDTESRRNIRKQLTEQMSLNAKIRTDLETEKARANSLEDEIKRVKQRNTTVEMQLIAEHLVMNKLKQDLAKEKGTTQDYKNDLEKEKGTTQDYKNDLEKEKSKTENVKKDLQKAKDDLTTEQVRYLALAREKNGLEDKLRAAYLKITEKDQLQKTSAAAIAKKDIQIKNLTEDLDTMEKNAVEAIEEKAQQKEVAEKRATAAEEKIVQLSSRLSELEANLKENTAKTDAFKTMIAHLQANIVTTKTEKNQATQSLTSLREQLTSLEIENGTLKDLLEQKKAEHKSRLIQFEEETNELTKDLEGANELRERAQNEFRLHESKLREVIIEQTGKLGARDGTIKNLEAELAELRHYKTTHPEISQPTQAPVAVTAPPAPAASTEGSGFLGLGIWGKTATRPPHADDPRLQAIGAMLQPGKQLS